MKSFALSVALSLPSAAFAQAWVGPQNSLDASLTFNHSTSNDIVYSDGQTRVPGPMSQQSFVIGAEFVPIENLALSVSLPYIRIKDVEPADPTLVAQQGRCDGGKSCGSLTDLRLIARYGLSLPGDLAVAPHAGVSVPVANYAVHGNTGLARGLKQLHMGLSIGYLVQEGLPGLYGAATYEFSLTERFGNVDVLRDFNQNSSSVSTQLGYFITQWLDVHLAVDGRIGHGGFDFLDWNENRETGARTPIIVVNNYNVLLNQSIWTAGGGATVRFLEQFSIAAVFRRFISGGNTADPTVLGLSLGWQSEL